MTLRTVANLLVLGATAFSEQMMAPTPSFEVASVKRADPADRSPAPFRGGPGSDDPGRFTYSNTTLRSVLQMAYGVRQDAIFGLGWLDTERYNLVAKVPAGATKEQFAQMLQALLAERFAMVLHHETKELSGYEMVVAKNGPKMKEPETDTGAPTKVGRFGYSVVVGKDGNEQLPPGKPGMKLIAIGKDGLGVRLSARMKAPGDMVTRLSSELRLPVVDKTGLLGPYDFNLDFSLTPPANIRLSGAIAKPDAAPDAAEPSGPDLITAMEQQLGLRLELKKIPVDCIVVDRASRVPTEN